MANREVIEQISDLVEGRREAELDFLRKLVKFDTSIIDHGISGKKREAQEWISEYLKELGARVDIFEPDNDLIKSYPGYNAGHKCNGRPNVVGTFWEDQPGRSLLLNGHVDVVPPGDEVIPQRKMVPGGHVRAHEDGAGMPVHRAGKADARACQLLLGNSAVTAKARVGGQDSLYHALGVFLGMGSRHEPTQDLAVSIHDPRVDLRPANVDSNRVLFHETE